MKPNMIEKLSGVQIIERAKRISDFRKVEAVMAKISEVEGIAESTAYRYLQVDSLPEDVKEEVLRDRIDFKNAVKLAGLSPARLDQAMSALRKSKGFKSGAIGSAAMDRIISDAVRKRLSVSPMNEVAPMSAEPFIFEKQVLEALKDIASGIAPTGSIGATDAMGGWVSSHTEAVMGVTAALKCISHSISELAEAVKGLRN